MGCQMQTVHKLQHRTARIATTSRLVTLATAAVNMGKSHNGLIAECHSNLLVKSRTKNDIKPRNTSPVGNEGELGGFSSMIS